MAKNGQNWPFLEWYPNLMASKNNFRNIFIKNKWGVPPLNFSVISSPSIRFWKFVLYAELRPFSEKLSRILGEKLKNKISF